jgi:hypothetical protein
LVGPDEKNVRAMATARTITPINPRAITWRDRFLRPLALAVVAADVVLAMAYSSAAPETT